MPHEMFQIVLWMQFLLTTNSSSLFLHFQAKILISTYVYIQVESLQYSDIVGTVYHLVILHM
jgi:hypothetical protein